MRNAEILTKQGHLNLDFPLNRDQEIKLACCFTHEFSLNALWWSLRKFKQ